MPGGACRVPVFRISVYDNDPPDEPYGGNEATDAIDNVWQQHMQPTHQFHLCGIWKIGPTVQRCDASLPSLWFPSSRFTGRLRRVQSSRWVGQVYCRWDLPGINFTKPTTKHDPHYSDCLHTIPAAAFFMIYTSWLSSTDKPEKENRFIEFIYREQSLRYNSNAQVQAEILIIF